MEEVTEISIGHFLISQSVFEGLPAVVRGFKALIAAARQG
jgi:pyridoxine 5-phosphate synthase